MMKGTLASGLASASSSSGKGLVSRISSVRSSAARQASTARGEDLAEGVALRPARQARGAILRAHRLAVVEAQPVAQADAPDAAVVRDGVALRHLRPRPAAARPRRRACRRHGSRASGSRSRVVQIGSSAVRLACGTKRSAAARAAARPRERRAWRRPRRRRCPGAASGRVGWATAGKASVAPPAAAMPGAASGVPWSPSSHWRPGRLGPSRRMVNSRPGRAFERGGASARGGRQQMALARPRCLI